MPACIPRRCISLKAHHPLEFLFRRLGGGNFGVTYEAVLDKERLNVKTLSEAQKKNRVVVKKVGAGNLGPQGNSACSSLCFPIP